MTPRIPAEGPSIDDLLNPRRAEELAAATAAAEARLHNLGVELAGSETSEEIVQMLDAIERFEQAVTSHGGDLMMDEPPAGEEAEPDDPDFALPPRTTDLSPTDYIRQVDLATARIQRRGDEQG
jgi:hypothetical protein